MSRSDSAIITSVKLNSAPALLSVSGLFDIEWRVVVACRDGRIYNIKNGEIRGSAVLTGSMIDSYSLATAIARQDKHVCVATMDKQLSLYSVRGKRVTGMVLPECVMEICIITSRRSSANSALLVALQSGEIRLYKGNIILNSFFGSPSHP